MPIHDLGYRSWQGTLTSPASRWWVIAETGARLAWSPWLRRILFFAWLPTIYFAIMFFAFEQSASNPGWRVSAAGTIGQAAGWSREQVAYYATADMDEIRHDVWSNLLMILFRTPQGLGLLLVIGLIAPPLIANDVRSRAFLLYFSRPITRFEYILGKAAVVIVYGSWITLGPALSLYLVALLLSPDLSVVRETWDLPLRAVAATLVLMVPTTLMALAFSALAKESRYAGFAWFAVWALGWAAYAMLTAYTRAGQPGPPSGLPPPGNLPNFELVSIYHTLGSVQAWVFGTGVRFNDIVWPAASLTLISAVSLMIIVRRVSAPMRV